MIRASNIIGFLILVSDLHYYKTNAVELVDETCLNATCTFLWKSDEMITWIRAKELCEDKRGSLVSIENELTQQNIVRLIGKKDGFIKAWTGGKRTEDETWRTLWGQELNIDNYSEINGNAGKTNCLYIETSENKSIIKTDECHEDSADHMGICIADNANCSADDLNMTGKCFTKITDLQSDSGIDSTWYDVHNQCSLVSGGSWHMLDDISHNVVMKLVPKGKSAWIGYWRRPWVWTKRDTMSYFKWSSGQGDLHNTDRCMQITTQGSWTENQCESKLHYYLCENRTEDVSVLPKTTSPFKPSWNSPDITTETTSQQHTIQALGLTTGVSVVDQTTLFENQSGSISTQVILVSTDNCESARTKASNDLYMYIGIAIGSLVLIVIIIIIIVICVRRQRDVEKKQMQSNGLSAINQVIDINDAHETGFTNDYELAHETPPSPTISPYGEFKQSTGVVYNLNIGSQYNEIGQGQLVHEPDSESTSSDINAEQDSSVVYSVVNKDGKQRAGRHTGAIYATVSKKISPDVDDKKSPEVDDMENIVIDNVTYGAL